MASQLQTSSSLPAMSYVVVSLVTVMVPSLGDLPVKGFRAAVSPRAIRGIPSGRSAQPGAHRVRRDLGAAVRLDPRHDVGEVDLYGLLGDAEGAGDLPVGRTLCHESGYLPLPVGQRAVDHCRSFAYQALRERHGRVEVDAHAGTDRALGPRRTECRVELFAQCGRPEHATSAGWQALVPVQRGRGADQLRG